MILNGYVPRKQQVKYKSNTMTKDQHKTLTKNFNILCDGRKEARTHAHTHARTDNPET